MSDMLTALQNRRNNVWEQMKALADAASEANRSFSAEEQGSWDAMNAELDQLDARMKSAMETEQRAKDAEAQFEALRGKPKEHGPDDQRQEQGSEELRKFLSGEGPRVYNLAPSKINFRDLSKLTNGAGGNTVPTDFYGRLVAHLIETSAVLQSGATILNTAAGEVLQVPKTTSHSTAAIVNETAAIGESDPAFGQVSLGAYKYGTMIQVSRELLTDTGVDLEGYLAMQAGRALGNAFGAHAITGSGTGQPRGIVTDATVGKTGLTGDSGGFGDQSVVGEGADQLIDLFHSVIAPYRQSSACHWMMNDSTAGVIRKIKTTEGQYIWQPSVIVGQPDTILGKPVLTDPNVADVGLGAKSVIFGDFSQYFVRLAGGFRFERSDEFAFSNDLVTFRALMRADSALVDLTGAVKVYQGGAS